MIMIIYKVHRMHYDKGGFTYEYWDVLNNGKIVSFMLISKAKGIVLWEVPSDPLQRTLVLKTYDCL